jgi:sugar phosphate isomerase/epimerase
MEMVRPYKEAAKKHGVAFSQVHAPFPMWAQDNEALNQRMKDIMLKSITVTAYLECPHCIIHPAYTFLNKDRYSPEDEWAVNRELYSAMIPTLKQYKVMALLENMFSRDAEGIRFASACNDYYEAGQWIDRLNEIAGEECFGFCFDTGHCNLARQNIYRAVKLLGSRLKALHMQDNSGHLDDHRAPFTGTVDWEGFLRGLKEIGYQGDLNFEAGSAITQYPAEMTEDCIRMLALTGQYFRKRLLD